MHGHEDLKVGLVFQIYFNLKILATNGLKVKSKFQILKFEISILSHMEKICMKCLSMDI